MTFPHRDDPDYPAYMAGYRRGEAERIALAAANSELRSEVLWLTTQVAEEHARVMAEAWPG